MDARPVRFVSDEPPHGGPCAASAARHPRLNNLDDDLDEDALVVLNEALEGLPDLRELASVPAAAHGRARRRRGLTQAPRRESS